MFPPTATDITAGLELEGFEALSPAQRGVVYTLLARAAERSYRRGFQQGAWFTSQRPDDLPSVLHDWRYGMSADASPWADSRKVEPSIERLTTESRDLVRVLGPVPKRASAADDGHDNYVGRLEALASAYQRAVSGSNARLTNEAWQRLRAFGVELDAIGPRKMVEVYDDTIEAHGDAAVRGVLPVWDGIGGQYLS